MNFMRVFGLDTGRFLGKRKILFLLVFFLLALYLIQTGIMEYKGNLKEINRFQEFEKTRIKNYQYYDQYGFYGVRLLYIPDPLSALFNNAGIFTNNLNAFVDSGERMKIYEPFKGKNAFISYSSVFVNLSGLFYLLGSLLSLFYGLEAFQDKKFLIFLDSVGTRKNLFGAILASRLLLLLGYLLFIIATTLLLYKINSVSVDIFKIAIYGLVVFFMAATFLLLGMLIGAIKSKPTGLVAVFTVWLVFVFALPAIEGKIVYKRAEYITSAYEMDIETFKLMMNIEKRAKEVAGQMDKTKTQTEIRQKLHEYFWNNEFKNIFKHEQNMINEMKGVISLHNDLSLIFPTSFFLSVNNEISGRGYNGLMLFYEYVLEHKKGFIQFYAQKSFYEGSKEVESYLKGDENIFHAPSSLPVNFGFGLFVSLFWLLVLLFLNWLAFNHLLNRRPDFEAPETEIKDLKQDEFRKGRITTVVTFNPTLMANFLELLRKHENRYIFTPGPDSLPGNVRVKNLFSFFGLPVPERLQTMADKYIDKLKPDYKALVLVEIIRTFDEIEFFIFNDFLAGLSSTFAEYFTKTLETLKKGRKVVYFTDSIPKDFDDVIRRANDRKAL